MSQLMTLTEAAAFLNVQERTVRALSRRGRLNAITVPGSRTPRFQRGDLQRYADQRRTPRSAPIGIQVRTTEPELVTANDLRSWTGRVAQDTAPELLRRLLRTTKGVSSISVRAGDGVALGGWDGFAHSDGSAGSFLPTGRLGIEIGTTPDVEGKADEDYDNRLSILKSERQSTHFVFVTTRRWRDKARWAAAKSALDEFASVTVLDADDLEGWLQTERNVHVWLSELFGRHPREVQSLDRWWREFSRSTDPVLPERLFELTPSAAVEEMRAFVGGGSADEVLIVRGTWRDQVLATMYQAFRSLDAESTPIVVHTAAAWARMLENDSSIVLIPLFDEPDLGGALARGHRVALAATADTPLRPGTKVIDIAPLGRHDAAKALEEQGLGSTRAERLAALFRRSPRAFVRSIALDPRARAALPGASVEDSGVAARLSLVTQWSSREADRRFLERLTGSDWESLERLLLAQELTDDPMFVRAGDSWRVAAPIESSVVQFPRLTSSDLGVWMAFVRDVLLEPHPFDELDQAQRLLAEIKGEERPRTATLVEGVTQGLALVALVEERIAGGRGSELVAAVVRNVLLDDEGLIVASTWKRLAPSLPLLAEAAPDVFVDSVLDDLSGRNPAILELFPTAVEPKSDLFSPTSAHVYLLWALELLARSAENYNAAMRALTNLSELTSSDERSGNSAFGSLENFLYPWLQYSDAGTSAKVTVVERLALQKPDLAWRVLVGLLPSRQFFSLQPARPRFREWGPEEVAVSSAEWLPVVDRLVELTVTSAGRDLSRWAHLTPKLDDLSARWFDRMVSGLEEVVQGAEVPTIEGRALWRALDSEIRRHKEHEAQDWALAPEQVTRLEAIRDLLPSPGVAARHAELFGWWPHIEGLDRSDDDFGPAWHRLQVDAMEEILAFDSVEFEEVVDLAENPYGVGGILAEWPSDGHDALMIDWLASSDESRAQASRGYLSRRLAADDGAAWAETTLRELNEDEDRGLALALLLEVDVAIGLLDRTNPLLAERYWQRVNPWRVAPDHARSAFERLLAVHRPLSALSLLELTSMREAAGAAVGFEVADASSALNMVLQGKNSEPIGGDSGRVIASALDFLAARGADIDTLAPFEFYFFAFIEHSSHHAAALFAVLRNQPSEFVNLVKMATKGEGEERSADTGLATLAWRVLQEWTELPGTDGTTWDAQPDQLRQWVSSARELLAVAGRAKIGDELIGGVLATGAKSADEGWPSLAVRDLLEDLSSRDVERGFHSSARNARGGWTKSAYEGGDQERQLAERFRARAEECREWPRTSRVLRAIADAYDREAHNEDASAKWDEDDA